ncbi:helix-turn-helix transcriptional regulator [Lactobacillus helveticus]|uniref:helix-turn-helix transcriptional regulator n=1 Tax=Lactobacillus helveticus TaxID=1587 RepID=UPI0015673380|nr:helix-turn-helix transcriptional regulator [Lactobacillus helveticus]NRO16930.1 HTH-type transcriptional regulator ImmR [Lactobacillus helveticus]
MNRIKELREHKGIGQKELAEKIGVTQQTISLYENSKREPKLATWQKLANFFNVPVTYIAGMSDIDSLKTYENFESWIKATAVDYSDSKGALVPYNEVKAFTRELTLKEFESLFKAVEHGDSVRNNKELENLRKKISSTAETADINFFTGSAFQLALKAKTGDGKAQKAYNQINKIINNYFGYDDEEKIYEIQGKDNK